MQSTKMIDWDKHFRDCLTFIEKHSCLINCHLVDFITKNLWNECLPDFLRLELEAAQYLNSNGTVRNHDLKELRRVSQELNALLENIDSLSLKNSQLVTKLVGPDSFVSESSNNGNAKKNAMNFMSDKKHHEIKVLTRLVGRLAKENAISLVIDTGAGKGYLPTSISKDYGIPVLAIDSSDTNIRGALNRQELLSKKKKEHHASVRYVVQCIDEKTNFENIIRSQFGEGNASNACILTGLHTCGQLAHSMIRHFLSTDCLKCLCVVPCCYHLTNETLAGNYDLATRSRMLAQQSVERTELKESGDSHSPSLFYRALLQVVLRSVGIPDQRIGRGAPTRDFPTYAQWALTKIGIDREKMPSTEALAQVYHLHSSSQWKLNVFQSIRIHLGSVVEAAIILDRIIYLRNSDRCSKVELIKLFDPLISPRCYAILALK